MATGSKSNYDVARAREFLDAYGQKVNPSSVAGERQKAATTLLAALLGAGENIPGIRMRVVPGKNSVEVEGLRGSVVVECTPDGNVVVDTGNGKFPVPIEFDRSVGRLVGTELDDAVAPMPGHRKQRRDALAVVAELVVNALAAFDG
ncbi:MAG TPA: hypothetical protein VF400_13560 [Anaeromyxobacteraceae bacterium]